MPIVVLTLLGTDHAGMVAAVSSVVADHGGSWERSRMAHLAGTFAGIAEIEVPARHADALVAAVENLSSQGLRVAVERSDAIPAIPVGADRLTLTLVGADHPGIVAEVSALLAEHRVNVEELTTRVVDAPMAGGNLFEAEIVVAVPATADVAELRGALEAVANELMVDVDFHESD